MTRSLRMGLLVLAAACSERSPSATTLLTACPDEVSGCVVMTLDAPDLPAILVSRVPAEGIQQALFTIRVPTRTADGDRGTTDLALQAFVDGMDCDAFGQAKAAVVGFTDSGEPILLTATGPLIVEGGSLRAGCPNCAELVTSAGEPATAAATLPAWDLSLAGIAWGSVSYRDDGHLLVSQEGRCLAIPVAGSVMQLPTDACAAPAKVDRPGRPSAPNAYPQPAYYTAPGRTYLLELETGACT